MLGYCSIRDDIARVTMNIAPALISAGTNKVFARAIAVKYLKAQCNIPLGIADVVYNCLMEYHSVCSHGNKLCDTTPRESRNR